MAWEALLHLAHTIAAIQVSSMSQDVCFVLRQASKRFSGTAIALCGLWRATGQYMPIRPRLRVTEGRSG
jgi:hypothetical protein